MSKLNTRFKDRYLQELFAYNPEDEIYASSPLTIDEEVQLILQLNSLRNVEFASTQEFFGSDSSEKEVTVSANSEDPIVEVPPSRPSTSNDETNHVEANSEVSKDPPRPSVDNFEVNFDFLNDSIESEENAAAYSEILHDEIIDETVDILDDSTANEENVAAHYEVHDDDIIILENPVQNVPLPDVHAHSLPRSSKDQAIQTEEPKSNLALNHTPKIEMIDLTHIPNSISNVPTAPQTIDLTGIMNSTIDLEHEAGLYVTARQSAKRKRDNHVVKSELIEIVDDDEIICCGTAVPAFKNEIIKVEEDVVICENNTVVKTEVIDLDATVPFMARKRARLVPKPCTSTPLRALNDINLPKFSGDTSHDLSRISHVSNTPEAYLPKRRRLNDASASTSTFVSNPLPGSSTMTNNDLLLRHNYADRHLQTSNPGNSFCIKKEDKKTAFCETSFAKVKREMIEILDDDEDVLLCETKLATIKEESFVKMEDDVVVKQEVVKLEHTVPRLPRKRVARPSTSTPMTGQTNISLPSFSGNSVQNTSSVSHIKTYVAVVPPMSPLRKQRPLNTTASSSFVTNRTRNFTTPRRNIPDLDDRQLQGLSFVLGASNDLPALLPHEDENAENEEEDDEVMANHLMELLNNGDLKTWDELVDQMDSVRKLYGKKDFSSYIMDRNRVIPRLKTTYESLNDRPTSQMLQATPARLTKQLKPHQQSGLKFMLWRETQDPAGGIIADDMGLGKTMSIIALVAETLSRKIPDKLRPAGIRYTGPTLVICPPSIAAQWAAEISSSSRGIKVLIHHGTTKIEQVEEFMMYDVVITSYYAVVNEKRLGKKLMYKVYWKRIVLDEGHFVRNSESQQCEAICALQGKMRWILTGTPVHNRVDDVFSYLKFLKCTPFDEKRIFTRWTTNRKGSHDGTSRLNVILKALMIRRTKAELQLLSAEKVVIDIEYDLEPVEAEAYKRLMMLSQALMKLYLNHKAQQEGTLETCAYTGAEMQKLQKIMFSKLNGILQYTHIFVLLLRLRQLCTHPALIKSMLTNGELDSDDLENEEVEAEHVSAISQIINESIENKDLFNIKNEIFSSERPSTKLAKLMEVLKEKFIPTQDKGIIVCEWPSFLDIIADHLSEMSLSFEMFTGKTDMKDRPEILKRFNSDCMNPRILLMSLGVGGVGLNLAKANHIFLMTTHWNPQNEIQAEDRCYRIGQTKNVFIYKFRASGTIEERIFNLQKQKLKIAHNIITGATGNNYRLTVNDLKSLFGI
ncbi:uncharacterized protein LOC134827673 [Culicoides brevitarsis]|uniref:uncharacterized protein LOC134827673 n=1 Tax=Culicoides brevitarsis TaxID=469753 RepID=UPI00307C2291